MKLARELGMSLRRCMREVDAREFREWQAEYRIEPWGDVREDLRSGVVASTIANVNRRRGSQPFKATDFCLEFGPPPPKTTRQLQAVMDSFMVGHNANLKHKQTKAPDGRSRKY